VVLDFTSRYARRVLQEGGRIMAIDFTFPEEVDNARLLARRVMKETVPPKMAELIRLNIPLYAVNRRARCRGLFSVRRTDLGGLDAARRAVATGEVVRAFKRDRGSCG
jgi:hypothetical protein